MLTLLERVLTLKSVAIFAATPDEVLTAIAAIATEEEYPAGAQIFAQGDPGASMYVIVRGLVHVYDERRTLSRLGDRAVFGELAMLDPEPRMASVSALEDTLLLRIDHRPFYELLADRIEVAQGIITILTSYVRDQLAHMSTLDQHKR